MKQRVINALDVVAEDLLIARNFYDQIEIGVGDYFSESILANIASLAIYAGIHHKHYGFYRLLGNPFPFSIYYDIIDDKVIVVAVLDMRRNPEWIQNTLFKRSST